MFVAAEAFHKNNEDGALVPPMRGTLDMILVRRPKPYAEIDLRGERAGDLLLLAHNGDRDKPAERYYFAAPYQSWHGSPSKQDSELPFIVASSTHTSAAIGAWVTHVLGDRPFQQKTTDVLLGLRAARCKSSPAEGRGRRRPRSATDSFYLWI